MSKIIIDADAFIKETNRLDTQRSIEVFRKIGDISLLSADRFIDLGTLQNSSDEESRSDLEQSEDEFDAKVAEYFDAERTFGYHYLTAEVGRLALTSEESTHDSDGVRLPHTILAAKIVDEKVELTKFRQSGMSFEELALFPEDWQAMDRAVSELGRVSSRLEEEDN